MNTQKPLEHLPGLKWVGKLSLQDADILAGLGKKATSILETGMGASTLIFSQVCKDVTSIESNPKWLELTKKRLEHLGTINNVKLLSEIDPVLKYEEYDLVFIDCLEETRFENAKKAWENLKPGGILLFHDTNRQNYLRLAFTFIFTSYREVDYALVNLQASDGNSSNTTLIKKVSKGFKEQNWKFKEGKEPWAYSEDVTVDYTRMWEYNVD